MDKKNNTYNKILETAQDLIIEKPYYTVSLNMIADKTGITKAALYYHFRNKEELFYKIFEQMALDFKEALDKALRKENTPSEKLKIFIITYIKFFFIKKNLIQLLVQRISKNNKKLCNQLKNTRQEIVNKLENIMRDILKKDERKDEISAQMASMMILGMLGTFFIEHAHNNRSKISPEKIANKIINFLKLK